MISETKNNLQPTKMEVDLEPPMSQEVRKLELLDEKIKEIEKGVLKKEPRFIVRALSCLSAMRKLLNFNDLKQVFAEHYSSNESLSKWIAFEPTKSEPLTENKRRKLDEMLPEVDAFLHLLLILKLVDNGKLQDALSCSDSLIKKICSNNRRSLDLIASKVYFFYSRVYELNGKSKEIRNFLFTRLRSCTLKSDTAGQAVLINCILRNYLLHNLYENADKFVVKVVFPEHASNNEWARFHYYLGRIKAIRLEYSDAQKYVTLALRKAPESAGIGFRQAANKLAICIELLLGDIPEKNIFKELKMKNALEPYLKLTQAVRDGDIAYFEEVLVTYGDGFRKDETFNLILRLRRNVIKTAVRSIGLSYARISPEDIAKKLGLESSEAALYVIAKAIRDGVLEAVLEPGFMVSQEIGDLYRTLTPSKCFRERIETCLELHNSSIKSLRFPVKKFESKLSPDEEQEDNIDDELDIMFI